MFQMARNIYKMRKRNLSKKIELSTDERNILDDKRKMFNDEICRFIKG
jgi:hypothetical protein